MTRPSWGHTSRRCLRCSGVGPRVPHGAGYIHAYCRTDEEKKAERKKHHDRRKARHDARKER